MKNCLKCGQVKSPASMRSSLGCPGCMANVAREREQMNETLERWARGLSSVDRESTSAAITRTPGSMYDLLELDDKSVQNRASPAKYN